MMVIFLMTGGVATAQEFTEDPRPVQDPVPTGAAYLYDMQLTPSGKTRKEMLSDVRMLVMVVGESVVSVGFESGRIQIMDDDGMTLKLDASGRLTGKQRVKEGSKSAVEYFLALDVKRQGGELTGTFSYLHTKNVTSKGARSGYLKEDVTGAVMGTAIDEKTLAEANAVHPEADWDSYLGTQQNFSAVDTGVELVDDLNDARLVWVGPYVGGMQIGDVRHGIRLTPAHVGGAATPLIHHGRVYQFHTRATGDQIMPGYREVYESNKNGAKDRVASYAKLSDRTVEQVLQRFAPFADEYMTCLDAATGKPLWRVKWPKAGLNYVAHKSAFSNQTGCVGDDTVFAFGTMGVVRALDAKTGRQLWSTPIPGYHEHMRTERQQIMGGVHKPRSREYAHGLNYIGGVVIVPTGVSECGLAGLDGKTGKLLWKGGVLGKTTTPVRWSHQDKEYVIAADSRGKVVCLDPITGQELWTSNDAGSSEHQYVVEGDTLLTTGGCFELSLTGAKRLWRIDESTSFNSRSVGLLYRGNAWIRGDKESGGLVIRRVADGKELHRDPTRGPTAEAMTFAAEGRIFYNHESQHLRGHMFELLKTDPASIPPLGKGWRPPHVVDLTYVIPVMYPVVDGRIYMRVADAVHCYDLRKN